MSINYKIIFLCCQNDLMRMNLGEFQDFIEFLLNFIY